MPLQVVPHFSAIISNLSAVARHLKVMKVSDVFSGPWCLYFFSDLQDLKQSKRPRLLLSSFF